MNCSKHPEKPAAGACVYCGKFYCTECLVEVKGKMYCRDDMSKVFDEIKEQTKQQSSSGPMVFMNAGGGASSSSSAAASSGGTASHPGGRRCLKCGYVGFMKTWLRHYNLPQLLAVVLLFFYLIPGIIFIAWGWGKYKCPQCGAVGKNVPA
ncbi:hypothetical protein U27_06579 [Candidatus Vecturithrix granuli]|uniref:B box-type domain-containing protein n=1 Tax=Vecturithrix granuli TaxID=1499967 RepID=A0A081C4T9_VECG1|nr:hypothetical protein U27_06579 [Candidatus Vecturithrix granuli]